MTHVASCRAHPSNIPKPSSPRPVSSIPPGAPDIPAIDRVVERARSRISPRVAPADLDRCLQAGALVVDIRPAEQRCRDGEIDGAVIVDRNVLEWRLDPTSPHRLQDLNDRSRQVVIVCDEGYASSLAAAGLADLGLTNVTDLDGGYQAWRRRRQAPTPAPAVERHTPRQSPGG
jgi:rhodanese-related sulfurtransferase